MTDDSFKSFAGKIALGYRENEPLFEHTTFKMGGPAEVYAEPVSTEQISEIVKYAFEHGIILDVLGKGSNLLVSDKGVKGIILHLGSNLSDIKKIDDNTVYCEAGASLARLCNFAFENFFTGIEFAYGIPGSVGGAVFMNAGAYGGEIKDCILYADFVDGKGNPGRFYGDELEMSYRRSVFSGSDKIITGAAFRFEKGEPEAIKSRMNELLQRRYDKQPMDKPSAGSTFKRPEGAYASALIDSCGLKGYRVGGASVSEKHAGFVVNEGGASFEDVMKLIENVSNFVFEKTGYKLLPEVEIWR